MKFITVTAPEGRKTPIHPHDGTDPTGALLHVEPGRVTRVRYSQDVRRAVNRGDLIPCGLDGRACALARADAPNALDTGPHVTDQDLLAAGLRTRPKPPEGNTDAVAKPSFDMSDIEGRR